MKKYLNILLLSIAVISSSCYNGSGGMNEPNQEPYTPSKIYLFDITDSSTHFISEGFRPHFLINSKRILFEKSTLWVYHIDSGEIEEIRKNYHVTYDEYSISPDENYLVHMSGEELKRLDLNTYESEILWKADNHTISTPPPRYSNEGNQIIFLSNSAGRNDSWDYDSLFVNIYNFNSGTSVVIDTVFDSDGDEEVYFTENSDKFYFVYRETINNDRKIILYDNTLSPKIINEMTIYIRSGSNKFWNIYDNRLLLYQDNELFQYDMIDENHYHRNNYDSYRKIRLLKNRKYIVGSDSSRVVKIMDLNGVLQYKYDTDAVGFIGEVDFSEIHNLIVIGAH